MIDEIAAPSEGPDGKDGQHPVHRMDGASLRAFMGGDAKKKEKIRAFILAMLRAAGADGLTDRELHRAVRQIPGFSRIASESFCSRRNDLWREFKIIPKAKVDDPLRLRILPNLETGEPTKYKGKIWILLEFARGDQERDARREWESWFPFATTELDALRREIAQGGLFVAVPNGLARRLLEFTTAGHQLEDEDEDE